MFQFIKNIPFNEHQLRVEAKLETVGQTGCSRKTQGNPPEFTGSAIINAVDSKNGDEDLYENGQGSCQL